MIFITDELGKFEKNIIELAENVGFKECKTIEAIDLFCGISERNDVLKEKDRYYAFIDIPQYWSVRADGLNGAIYDNKTKKANIYFKNPIEKRMVSRVEWIDRNNTVYKVDYYNKYGYMYCSENVSGGNVTVREFYDRNGDIKVLEQTGPKTYTTFGTRISPKSYRGFGGLAVIGIGRMNNSRSERQARGRAGRQGDPGFSQYYVSLEDDIVGAEDDDKLQRYIDGKKRIGKRKIKRIVNQCQKLSVESEEMNRKKSLQYDQVLQRQRDLIYATRKNLLDGASVEQEKIVEIAKENISDFVNNFDCIQSNKKHGRRRGRKKDNDKNTNTEQYTSILNRYILDNISYKLDAGLTLSDMQSAATVSDYLMLRVYQGLSRQRERIGDEEAYEQFVREATLKAVDDGWVELIDYLEQLKYAVAGRASAQRNVMFEYQNEAFESFLDTEKAVKCNIIRNILLSDVKIGKDGRLQVIYP